MEPGRFDSLTRSLSSRLSRRTALQASGLGLAAGVIATTSPSTSAQEGTPAPLSEDTTFLFVQSATSGTFAVNPASGTPTSDGGSGGADYLLTLAGHTGNTVYFSDRPERIFGASPTQAFLDGLGFPPNNPPNAALVTTDADGNEDILVVELFQPSFDATAGTVSYGVNILSDYEGRLDFVAGRQADEDLGTTFGEASLFIDDCPDLTVCDRPFVHNELYIGPLPGGSVGLCWHWSDVDCTPCNGNSNGYYDDLCNSTYPDCGGECAAF